LARGFASGLSAGSGLASARIIHPPVLRVEGTGIGLREPGEVVGG